MCVGFWLSGSHLQHFPSGFPDALLLHPLPHIPPHATSPAFPLVVSDGRSIQILYLKVLLPSCVNIHFILYNLQHVQVPCSIRSSLSVCHCDNVCSKMALSSLGVGFTLKSKSNWPTHKDAWFSGRIWRIVVWKVIKASNNNCLWDIVKYVYKAP